jgi:hypothetical protein
MPSPKLAQITTYFVAQDTSYFNINMRTVLGEPNFKLGDKYNLVLRAQMNDVSALPAHHRADRFIVSSNMMRFQNYETAVGKQASQGQLVSYATFPMFFDTNATCNTQITNNSCIATFTLESEMGFLRVQMQDMRDNIISAQLYPDYLLIFDIYKCD